MHKFPDECKRNISSMDFVKLNVYFSEEDTKGFHREDYYLAQIAFLIVQVNAKDPKKHKFEEFLLKFKTDERKKIVNTKDRILDKMAMSRFAWGTFANVQIPMDDLNEARNDDEELCIEEGF